MRPNDATAVETLTDLWISVVSEFLASRLAQTPPTCRHQKSAKSIIPTKCPKYYPTPLYQYYSLQYAIFDLEFRCDVTNYNIFLFRVIQPTQPSPTVSVLWEIWPCDSLVGFGRLKVSFYSENVILCENMKNSIFTIKSHFQPTVGYLPTCYRIEWLTGLGQLRWVG